MKRRLVMLGLCAAVLAIGISTWLFYLAGTGNASIGWGDDYFLPPTTKRMAPVTETDIVYPGASLVREDKGDGRYPYYRHTSWRASADMEQVQAFLEKHLPETGWLRSKDLRQLEFYRLEGQGDASWILGVSIMVGNYGNGEASIDLFLGRSPDITNIPIYPNAQSVEREGQISTRQGMQPSITTFLTPASPNEVEDYYERTLQSDYAWQPNPLSASIESDAGLIFGYSDIGQYSTLVIHAHRDLEGQTKVEIKLGNGQGMEVK